MLAAAPMTNQIHPKNWPKAQVLVVKGRRGQAAGQLLIPKACMRGYALENAFFFSPLLISGSDAISISDTFNRRGERGSMRD